MTVSLKTAFSILDGRLSTKIDDVYEMLGFIFSESLFTHQLPTAFDRLKEKNPKWFQNAVELITNLKALRETNDFQQLMAIIDKDYSDVTITLEKIDSEIKFADGLIPTK